MKTRLQESLEKLVLAIHSSLEERWTIWIENPQVDLFFKWKLEDFEYGDTGIIKKSSKGEYITKPSWSGVTWDVLKKVTRKDAYKEAFRIILKNYSLEESQGKRYLEQFITKISRDILKGKIKNLTDSNTYINSFLKDLNGEMQEYRAKLELIGLVLEPHSIRLDKNTRLRRPIRKDFEKEELALFPSFVGGRMQDPTAILHIKLYAKESMIPLQDEISRVIAVLRLFRVGSVQDLQHTTETDSIINIALGRGSSLKLPGPEKYLVTNKDVKAFKSYWECVKKVRLPDSAYIGIQKEPDELSIAYDRYCDSLEGGIIEKRISSAVMGLEALYLGGGEQQEMSYRLRARVGKLLSLIDYSPNEVSDKLKNAYEIRSKYVHGGILKQKDKNELETKYGNIAEFSKTIIEYLRASIVALLKRPNKKSLIQRLDESLLDVEKVKEIRQLLFMPY